jgi:antitoxin CptB
MKNRNQGVGVRSQEPEEDLNVSAASGFLNPESRILNPDVLKRMQWRCRRGLLELDIFLQPFIARHYATLSEAELRVFDALLDLPDNTLWDMMSGRQAVGDAAQSALLEKIKSA